MDQQNHGVACNIAFAGLTAAGKTTHAKLLAAELGYDYVSATDILLDLLNIDEPSEQVWFNRLSEINSARDGDAIDIALEDRIIELSRTCTRTVFDTWALAWIGDSPMVRIWIESDVESRTRKCVVSQKIKRLSPEECRTLLAEKDEFNRIVFYRRHGFDLFKDRQRYDAVLCNSHLIPSATAAAASAGIESFSPVVYSVAAALMKSDKSELSALRARHPKEILSISPVGIPCMRA